MEGATSVSEESPEYVTEEESGVWRIPGTSIKIRLRSLADYRQNENNPVAHSPRNFGVVVDSVRKLGALRSGFSSKGKILGGNLLQLMERFDVYPPGRQAHGDPGCRR